MCGGTIAIKPNDDFQGESNRNVIIGNTCVYGANGGKLFASGRAGERLAVRNSGCKVVVEGAGDHCCEYMTDGRVVVLGGVGRNLGAGMTGGLAYIMDESPDFDKRVSKDVNFYRITSEEAQAELYALIQWHAFITDSEIARKIIRDFDKYLPKFWQIVPPSEEQKDVPALQKEEKKDYTLESTPSKTKTLDRNYFDKVLN